MRSVRWRGGWSRAACHGPFLDFQLSHVILGVSFTSPPSISSWGALLLMAIALGGPGLLGHPFVLSLWLALAREQ